MNRARPVLGVLACILSLTLLACSDTKRPNILVIMADDLGRNDLGFYGNSEVSTPNLDGLFRKGIVLDRMYVDSSCRPTRAALMTGLDPARMGYATEGYGIPEDIDTLPRLLASHGYKTSHIGKWHLGYLDAKARPNGVGFDYFHGFLDQGFLRGPQQEPYVYRRPPTYINPWLVENTGEASPFSGHLQDIITEMAVARINNADHNKPWFVNVWFYAPHEPIEAAQRYLGDNPTPKDKYLASVKQLDDNVGAILNALEASGQSENTLVLFLSDNGGTNMYYDNNAPYTGKKTSFQEGGVRTPGVVAGAGIRHAPAVYTHPLQHIDVLPSLLEAAGIGFNEKSFDGRSHWRSLNGLEPAPDREFFWLRESPFGKEFGTLSKDGHWLLSRMFSPLNDFVLQDVTSPEAAKLNQISNTSLLSVKTGLLENTKSWMHDRATLRLSHHRQDSGHIEVTGQNFLRTPGMGRNTFGFSLKGEWRKGRHLIAEQKDVWSLYANDGMYEYRWGDISLAAPIPNTQGCQTLLAHTVTTLPSILSDATALEARLYVNGAVASQQRLDNTTFIPKTFPPTRIAVLENPRGDLPTVAEWTARNDLVFTNGNPLDVQASEVYDRLCKAQ